MIYGYAYGYGAGIKGRLDFSIPDHIPCFRPGTQRFIIKTHLCAQRNAGGDYRQHADKKTFQHNTHYL